MKKDALFNIGLGLLVLSIHACDRAIEFEVTRLEFHFSAVLFCVQYFLEKNIKI